MQKEERLKLLRVKLEEKNAARKLASDEKESLQIEVGRRHHEGRKSSTTTSVGSNKDKYKNIEHIEVLETYYMEPNSDSAIGQGLSVQTTTDFELSESYL